LIERSINMPRNDPAQTRARLLDAALRAFGEHGYEGASMRRIADLAGVAPGLAYHYFDSKEALLHALLADGSAKLMGTFAEASAVAEPRERIRALIRSAARIIASDPQYFRLSAGIRAQPLSVEGLAAQYRALQTALVAQWSAWLAEAGSPDPIADAHVAIAALTGIAQDAADFPDYPLEAVTERLISHLLREHR
jgi:AcrR family transcriptional regulator